jgi:hypothetical protein
MMKSSRLKQRSRRWETRKYVDLESGTQGEEVTVADGEWIVLFILVKNRKSIDLIGQD